jgi:hypothetical protein
LGQDFGFGIFHDLGRDSAERGLAQLDFASRSAGHAQLQPPALPFLVQPAWMARFVELIIRFATDHTDAPIHVAAHLYFDSGGTIDAEFLHSWLAAEALAKWALAAGVVPDPGRRRIADHDRWCEWVQQREDEIKSLAAVGQEQSLYDRVLGSDYDRPTPVERAFRGYELPWNTDMDDVQNTRHAVVHEGSIAPPGQRDWDRDRRRVGRIQTMLTALMAKLVGYEGPIADRSVSAFDIADTAEPLWWSPAAPSDDLEIDYRSGAAIAATPTER